MPNSAAESIHLLYVSALILATGEGEEVAAPVVILQNDPANVFNEIIEKHLHPKYTPQPDRFWRVVRDALNLDTWRPRVYRSQLKMLQHARLPHSATEWATLGEALSSLAGPYLRDGSTPEAMLMELQAFVGRVENWWAGRKRKDGSNGVAAAAATIVAASNKRPAYGVPGADMRPPAAKHMAAGEDMMRIPSDHMVSLDMPFPVMHGGDHSADPLPMPMLQSHPSMGDIGRVMSMAELMDMPPQQQQKPSGAERKILTLNVGEDKFSTTLATLEAVEGSYFWRLAQKVRAVGTTEFYLDRSSETFPYVLDYLRCQRYREDFARSGLPREERKLRLLVREAGFYRLPGLEKAANEGLAAPCDAVFFQTGLVKEEELDEAHADLIDRVNEAVASKAQHGLIVAERRCGHESRGNMTSVWYHIIFKL